MKIYINPPPTDRKCECCGAHIDKLKEFGKEGDPLVGNFEGSKLVKTFRGMCENVDDNDFLELKEKCKTEWKKFEKDLIKIKGKKKALQLISQDECAGAIGASWECRDCIVLYGKEYFKKRFK